MQSIAFLNTRWKQSLATFSPSFLHFSVFHYAIAVIICFAVFHSEDHCASSGIVPDSSKDRYNLRTESLDVM